MLPKSEGCSKHKILKLQQYNMTEGLELLTFFSRVKPIDAFGDSLGIKEASTSLVFNHVNSFTDHKVIRQRHQVRIVPVTKVTYEWKGKPHVFYVYGYENKIHLPKYPQKCCWGCQIL